MNSGIYQIRNLTTGRLYIGSAKDFSKRKYEHFRKLKTSKHTNSHLQASYNKHGLDCFVFEIVEHTNLDNLLIQEQYYLDMYGITNLYNKR